MQPGGSAQLQLSQTPMWRDLKVVREERHDHRFGFLAIENNVHDNIQYEARIWTPRTDTKSVCRGLGESGAKDANNTER